MIKNISEKERRIYYQSQLYELCTYIDEKIDQSHKSVDKTLSKSYHISSQPPSLTRCVINIRSHTFVGTPEYPESNLLARIEYLLR